MRIDEQKKKFFLSGMYSFQISSPPAAWKQQKEACDCYSQVKPCYDSECPYRGRNERFPADVGGEGQCLRLAQLLSPFAFRNVDGRVVAIPQSIIDQICPKSD